jgi:WD40 repeat protein
LNLDQVKPKLKPKTGFFGFSDRHSEFLINDLCISPNGKYIGIISSSGQTSLWNAISGSLIKILQNNNKKGVNVVFSADNNYILSRCEDEPAFVWNISNPNIDVQPIELKLKQGNTTFRIWGLTSFYFSLDSKMIASGTNLGKIIVWDAVDGKIMHILSNNQNVYNTISSIAWSPNNQYISVGFNYGQVQIWEMKPNTPICIFDRKLGNSNSERSIKNRISNLKWNLDGTCIISTSFDGYLKIINFNSPNDFIIFSEYNTKSPIISAVLCPDNENIIYSLYNKEVYSINISFKSEPIKIDTLLRMVKSIVFIEEQNLIIVGCEDGIIKKYNASDFIPILNLKQNGGKKNKANKKIIDTFKKVELVKIAKMYDVSLKTLDNKAKTKLQLFNSLKRKKLI